MKKGFLINKAFILGGQIATGKSEVARILDSL